MNPRAEVGAGAKSFERMIVTSPLVIRGFMLVESARADRRQHFPDGLLQTNIWIFSYYGGGMETDQFARINFRRYDPESYNPEKDMGDEFDISFSAGVSVSDFDFLGTAYGLSTGKFTQPKPLMLFYREGGGKIRDLSDSSEPHFLQCLCRIESMLAFKYFKTPNRTFLSNMRQSLRVFINQKNRNMEKSYGLAVVTPRYLR